MENPWTRIDLQTYEKHMQLDSVRQLQQLRELMRHQFSLLSGGSVMILGIAGGNGLDQVSPHRFAKIYGVDINANYLAAAEQRYPQLGSVLECLQTDLVHEADRLPRADLLIADLLIEYTGIPSFQEVVRRVGPRCVSCIIQVNGACGEWVSSSPYQRAFDGLNEIYREVCEPALKQALAETGFALTARLDAPLPNGKKLRLLDFVRTAGNARV